MQFLKAAMSSRAVPRGAYFVLFAVSGFAGLIYESIWTHYLKLFLGHAAYAQTLVLAIFMGGMALGARICAAYSSRWKRLLLGYAVAEGIIGLLALTFHRVFVLATDASYDTVFPLLAGATAIGLFKWALAAVLILPQSILLGMTFPLMTGGILRRYPGTPGAALSMLYFTNSLGAAAGILASGFLLIPAVGMPGTLLTAGLLNFALGIAVWVTVRLADRRAAADGGGNEPIPAPATTGDRTVLRLLLAAAFFSGAASFCYEIGWIRMLSLVLGSSTHSFEIMLAAFIFGLAFGGLWIRRRIDAWRDLILVLGLVLGAKGLLALATLPVYGQSFDLMQAAMGALNRTEASYSAFNALSTFISLAVMFPAAFFAGMSLPVATFALMRRGHGESSIGKVYAFNTAGAIAGVLLAVHVAMPFIGLKGLIMLGAAIDFAVALALLAYERAARPRRLLPTAAVLLGCALLATAVLVRLDAGRLASGVYRSGKIYDSSRTNFLFHEDGRTATVDVVESDGVRAILTNGKADASFMTGTGVALDEHTMVLLGALPLAHNPGAKRIANIGFGSGLTTHTLLASPAVEVVDSIEIEPAMVEGARLFGKAVERAFTDPRSAIHIEDAKAFFAGRPGKYDIIVSEPSNPWVSGVSGLFSAEFYHRMRQHLAGDGLLVQWIQLYEIDMELVASILKALGANFADYAIYETDTGNVVVIASAAGPLAPMTDFPLRNPTLASELGRLNIHAAGDLDVRRIGTKRVLQPLIESYVVPPNSDYFPIVDHRAAKARMMNAHALELGQLSVAPVPLMDMLSQRSLAWTNAASPEDQVTRRARRTTIAGHLHDHLLRGQPGSAQHLDAITRLRSTYLRDSLLLCQEPESRDLLVETLRELAPLLSAHLPPDSAEGTWRAIRAAPCYSRLGSHVREWIELLSAVSNRDARQMHARAGGMLDRNVAVGREAREYLLHVVMLGSIAAGDRARARHYWATHGARAIGDENIPASLRLLTTQLEPPPNETR